MEERLVHQAVEIARMRMRWFLAVSGGLLFLSLCCGCGSPEPAGPAPVETSPRDADVDVERAPAVVPSGFAAARIEILPLTELAPSAEGGEGTQLNVYISLLDAFGSQIKAPGIVRFELYDYVQRSAEPKGQRIAIWPDLDLTSPAENQKFWRDFLRAYAFTFETQASRSRVYILEATCICPGGRRLSADFVLRPDN
jgi:hypothetical protein